MKYTNQIIIELPREEVIQKLDNSDNLKHWQQGLVSYKVLNGTPGQDGAKMKLDYKMGKRDMSLIETIIKNDFPKAFHASYDTKGAHNIQNNYFEIFEDNKTRWINENEFEFAGFGMKLMAFFMPRLFKKQSLKYLNDFKNFAEKGISVSNKQ